VVEQLEATRRKWKGKKGERKKGEKNRGGRVSKIFRDKGVERCLKLGSKGAGCVEAASRTGTHWADRGPPKKIEIFRIRSGIPGKFLID